jgi:hypothetical protein
MPNIPGVGCRTDAAAGKANNAFVNMCQIARALAIAVFLPLFFSSGSTWAQQPRIDRFDLDPPRRLMAGEALIFRIQGSAKADVSVRIEGVKDRVALHEIIAGIYEGAYTIKLDDKIKVDSVVTGIVRIGNEERSKVLGQSLVDNSRSASSRDVPTRRENRLH